MQWYSGFYQLTHDFSALPFHYSELRQIIKVTTSLAGSCCRLKMTNLYGRQNLIFDEVILADNPEFKNSHQIYCHHQEQIVIPRGQYLFTDPVSMPIHVGQSLYIQMEATRPQTYADFASTYQPGITNATISRGISTAPSFNNHWHSRKGWFSLESLEVQTDRPVFKIEITGDSLVESGMVTEPLIQYFNRQFPNRLVWYQTGIAGNQLMIDAPVEEPLYETFGISLLHRHQLQKINSNLTLAIIGTNDLLLPYYSRLVAEQNVTPQQLALGFQRLRYQCRLNKSKLLTTTIATLRMFDTANLQPSEEIIDRQRQLLNHFLLQQPGVVDGGTLLTDHDTGQLRSQYDFGDHLHWSPAGGRQIAKLFIPLIQHEIDEKSR